MEVHENAVRIDGKTLSPPGDWKAVRWSPAGSFGRLGAPDAVPAGCCVLLADNGVLGRDSRYWGAVPRGDILGQVIHVEKGDWNPLR